MASNKFLAQGIASAMTVTCMELHKLHAEILINERPLTSEVGRGRKTYHQSDGNENKIVFGAGMVESHLDGKGEKWGTKSEKAMITGSVGTPYFLGGGQTLLKQLARVILHEYAHYLQALSGGRQAGSVHNDAFYTELNGIYDRGFGQKIESSLELKMRDLGLSYSQMHQDIKLLTPADLIKSKKLSEGLPVIFGKKQDKKGIITEINERKGSVLVRMMDGSIWGVSPGLVTPSDSVGLENYNPGVAIVNNPPGYPENKPNASKAALSLGSVVTFNHNGRPITGILSKINPKTYGIKDQNQVGWRVSKSLVSLANKAGEVTNSPLKKSVEFKAGDPVSFESREGTIFGEIIKVNPKTCKVRSADAANWKVSKSLLSKVEPEKKLDKKSKHDQMDLGL